MYKCTPIIALAFGSVLLAADLLSTDALFQAIQQNDPVAMRRLLDGGLSANAQDDDGTPALMVATLFAGSDCIRLLLDRGANPNVASHAGATALMWAIPDSAKVKLLVAHGADVNARSTNLQRTPLLIAASYPGTVEILRLLVDKGADIHAKDKDQIHALGRATLSADVAVVRFLAENGCDVNEPGYENHELAPYARNYLPAIEYLMSKGAKINPFALITTNWHDSKLVERWTDMGAEVNAIIPGLKWTPLMMAAASEQTPIATLKLLLDKGADPNAEDAQGERPLDWATYRNDPKRVEMLKQFGAKPGNGPRHTTFPPPEGISDARTSISRSALLLLTAAPVVFQQRGCITCHNQTLPAQVAALARKKGVAVNQVLARKNFAQILSLAKPYAEEAMQGERPQGAALGAGYIMTALAAEQYPLDKTTAAFAHLLAGQQMSDGSWLGNGVSRPPMEDSTISTTVMGVRGLTLYSIPGGGSQLKEALRRAGLWLKAAPANSAEERSMRLMGLVWTKASSVEVHAATQQVTAHQREDGGWSQQSALGPDAYATGMALCALREAGVPVTAETYRRGIAFLLKNQYRDGAWLVHTRSFPVQPYFDSGYPFGPNQWISSAGASWATLAIAHTLPDVKPRGPAPQ